MIDSSDELHVCDDCGAAYDEGAARQCPVCGNAGQIDRIKRWIRRFTSDE